MNCLTKKALWPHDEKCWSSLFRFCRDHGTTLMRPVIKAHASSDFQGGLTDELTTFSTTERCSAGFLFGRFALRQARSNDSFWEIIEGYLEEEKVVLEIRSWDDLAAATSVDSALANAVRTAKSEARAKRDAWLASLPEPTKSEEPKKSIHDDIIDWSDYDDDDWDDSHWG